MNPVKVLCLFGRAAPLILSILLLSCGGELSPTPDVAATETAVVETGSATLTGQSPSPSPTPSLQPTPTKAPTPTNEPTATPSAEIGRVLWIEDNFEGTNRLGFEGFNPHFENGALLFTSPENGTFLFASRNVPLTNFRLQASIAGDGDYGLSFGGSRESQINYNLILFRNGELALNLHQGEEFLGAVFSKKVLNGAEVEGFHHFGLEYNGEILGIFFGGKKVGEVGKMRLRGGLEAAGANGRIGLNCWDQGKKNVSVGIDSLRIDLPEELIPPTPTPIPASTETPPPSPVAPCPARSEQGKQGLLLARDGSYVSAYGGIGDFRPFRGQAYFPWLPPNTLCSRVFVESVNEEERTVVVRTASGLRTLPYTEQTQFRSIQDEADFDKGAFQAGVHVCPRFFEQGQGYAFVNGDNDTLIWLEGPK